MKKTYIVGLISLTLSCGAPLGPAPSSWETLATFPGELSKYYLESIAADGDVVFFSFQKDILSSTIIRYLDGVLTTVFVIDLKGADGAVINDIAINNSTGWAVGARGYSSGAPRRPFLIQYDGKRWKEMEISGRLPEVVFHAAAPISGESCWVLASESWLSSKKAMSLWKYERGALVEYPAVKAEAVVYDAETATTFALVRKDGVQVLISPDYGVTWFEEKVREEKPWPNYEPDRISACAANGVLYVATTDTDGYPMASIVYRRVGPPGVGEYELLLYCPEGPNFLDIKSIGVDGCGRVVAVGNRTSVYYDGVSWVQESLPLKNHFYDVTVARTGFFAVAADENWNNLQLLYHP